MTNIMKKVKTQFYINKALVLMKNIGKYDDEVKLVVLMNSVQNYLMKGLDLTMETMNMKQQALIGGLISIAGRMIEILVEGKES